MAHSPVQQCKAAVFVAPRRLTPGEAIRMARDQRGISNYDLARELGTHQPIVTRTQRIAHMPRVSTLLAYLDALGARLLVQLPDGTTYQIEEP